MKRRIVAALFATMMMFSTTMPSMAAESSQDITGTGDDFTGGNASIDVNSAVSKADGTTDGVTIYSVDVTWTMTPGTYNSTGDNYLWNALNRRYERHGDRNTQMKKNKDASVTITITNRSNAAVDYEIGYVAETDGSNPISKVTSSSGVSGTLSSAAPSDAGLTGSPDSGTAGSATSASYLASVGFSDSFGMGSKHENKKMGNYTVTINKHTEASKTTSYTPVSPASKYGNITYGFGDKDHTGGSN